MNLARQYAQPLARPRMHNPPHLSLSGWQVGQVQNESRSSSSGPTLNGAIAPSCLTRLVPRMFPMPSQRSVYDRH